LKPKKDPVKAKPWRGCNTVKAGLGLPFYYRIRSRRAFEGRHMAKVIESHIEGEKTRGNIVVF
jgi:hypothetical protein